MECFNDLLHKLREVHEREVEGWQVKVQELSNKKGCDTKRMEELFTRNQQMKEQQRLLTENIKTLENRLRAGLCDRCTVTQEVAKRRQQEFEASQIQGLHHISLLVGELNNLRKENKRLRDEIRTLKAALEGPSNQSSSSSASEVKPNSSPEHSPSSSGPVALITNPATSRAGNQPADGDVAVKTEMEQRSEETEQKQQRGTNRSHLESYKPHPLSPLGLPPWKVEHNTTRDRRSQGVEVLDQHSSIPPPAHLKTSSSSSSPSSSPGRDVKPSRHVLHAPVPCRPQPTKSSSGSHPWPFSDSSDWVNVAAAGTNPLIQTCPKLNFPRFPNLIPTSQQASLRRPGFGSPWQKQSASQPPNKEPTVVFRLRELTDFAESQTKPPVKKETPPLKIERVSGEAFDGPLDLSDRGKSKSSKTTREDSPLALQSGSKLQKSPDKDVNPPVSSPSPAVLSSSSCTTPIKQQEEEPTSDHNHKMAKEQEQNEEVNGKTDQSNGKKVPVLTISLRPVVVLETLNSALQKQESLSSNGKSSSPEDEPETNSDDQDENESSSGRESSRGCKRKRTSVETETDRDSDSGNRNQDGKIKITVRNEEKSSS
ncbi:RBBP8 N-terminal-like protein isoform X2 [Amphiprion ocellaris]|uniref:RBBP8 N-terminal-like protein isoform X2 n=1 Tax=Amphiprion ocellaris TaxID=80972 RepID=UPI0024110909|nr:RBBP8 N-terminal-like protein isoform X2 [Amphiprion ocellaris]